MKCYAKSSENLIVQLANLPPKPPFLSKSFHLFSCTGKTHYLCISSAKNKEQNKTFLPFNFQNIGRQLVQYAASKSAGSDVTAPEKHNALLQYIQEYSTKDTPLYGGVIIQDGSNWLYSKLPIENTTDLLNWDAFYPENA